MTRKGICFIVAMFTTLALLPAMARLEITENSTDYTIIASNAWEMKVKKASGCIWSFKDLTAGSGELNFLGQDAYNFSRSLFMFGGRGTTADYFVCAGGDSDPWASRYSYSIAANKAWFKIIYTELPGDGISTYLYGGNQSPAVNGDILSSVVIKIREPTPEGTIIEWRTVSEGQKTDDDELPPLYFLKTYAGPHCYIADGRNQAGNNAGTGEGINMTRTIELNSEWAEAEVKDTTLNTNQGFIPGRMFRLERLTGGRDEWDYYGISQLSYSSAKCTYVPPSAPQGSQGYSSLYFNNMDGMIIRDASNITPNLPGNFVKEQSGRLTINITKPPVGAVLTID